MMRVDEFDYCKNKSCGKELKPVKVPRTKGKLCADCRGDAQSDNTLLRRQFIEDQKNPTIPGEDELMFDDCPIAVKETSIDGNDGQKYHKIPIEVRYIGSSLAEVIPPTVTKYDSYGKLKYQSKKKELKHEIKYKKNGETSNKETHGFTT
tara:strand:+ start:711 stop:1160 length:450 start_codon:yes stop_codon:yes gene_type:complete